MPNLASLNLFSTSHKHVTKCYPGNPTGPQTTASDDSTRCGMQGQIKGRRHASGQIQCQPVSVIPTPDHPPVSAPSPSARTASPVQATLFNRYIQLPTPRLPSDVLTHWRIKLT